MGPCYYYVWEELNYFSGGKLLGFFLGEDLDDKSLYPSHVMRFLEWPTATGEVCTGAALALGLVRTLLWGKPGGTVCTPDCAGKPCNADDGCGTPCPGACSDDSGVGPDGGVPTNEAGPPVLTEAGAPVLNEAGVPVRAEAGPPTNSDTGFNGSSGCSCSTGGNGQGAVSWIALALLALLGFRRR